MRSKRGLHLLEQLNLFGLILSGLMSLLVSGISTMRATALGIDFLATWSGAWLTTWLVAFPVVLVVVPIARRALDRFLADS